MGSMDSIAELIENTFSDRNVEVVRLRGKFELKAFTTSIYLLLADAVILSCYPVILSICLIHAAVILSLNQKMLRSRVNLAEIWNCDTDKFADVQIQDTF